MRLPRKIKKSLKKSFGVEAFSVWVRNMSNPKDWIHHYVYVPYIMDTNTKVVNVDPGLYSRYSSKVLDPSLYGQIRI